MLFKAFHKSSLVTVKDFLDENQSWKWYGAEKDEKWFRDGVETPQTYVGVFLNFGLEACSYWP